MILWLSHYGVSSLLWRRNCNVLFAHSKYDVSKGHEVTVFISDHSIDCPLQILNENLIRIVRFKPGEKDIYKYLGYAAALSYDISEIIEGL